MLVIKLKNRIISVLKIFIYKIIYWKKLNIKNIFKSYILENSKIVIGKNGKLKVNGIINCRENVKINVSSGTLIIGKDTFINKDTSINVIERVVIGNNCLIGENVKIYDHDHVFDVKKNILEPYNFITSSVIIGNNVWIGSGTIILKGVSIGNNVVIAAGSIITKNIGSNQIYKNKIVI